jgi:ribosomal protein L29
MDFKELQTKTLKEWHSMLVEAREKLRQLRFKDANKQLGDVREIRRERDLIARLLTLINKHKNS